MSDPIVSIITPSYNREYFVADTLDSLLSQEYKNWENIVVDDGSTDATKDIIKAYSDKDSRIKVFNRDRSPKGACTCRNQGVDLSEGQYLVFLDTDDLLEPFCIEQRVKVMENNPALDFAIFPSLMFRDRPYDLGLWWNVDKEADELTRQFHQDAICQGTGVIWRKSSFNKIGQWDQTLYLWQDIDLFFRAYIQDYRYEKFFHLPPDLHNRCLETSLSRNNFFAPEKTQSRVKVLQQAVGMLKKNRKESYLTKARYMVAEIVSGLSRNGEPGKARELVRWAKNEGVLNKIEKRNLNLVVILCYTKFDKFPIFTRKIKAIEDGFRVDDCTLGVLPYQSGSVAIG